MLYLPLILGASLVAFGYSQDLELQTSVAAEYRHGVFRRKFFTSLDSKLLITRVFLSQTPLNRQGRQPPPLSPSRSAPPPPPSPMRYGS